MSEPTPVDPEALASWRAYRRPVGRWRQRALVTITEVIDANPGLCVEGLIVLIDEAYPFGPRTHAPYKAWLTERRRFLDAMVAPNPPTAEDAAACEVAIDLVEEGREAEARTMLDEQAPRRHNLKCPACGARPGKPCFDVETATWQPEPPTAGDPGNETAGHAYPDQKRVERIVPHLSRVNVAPYGMVLGPLFEAAP